MLRYDVLSKAFETVFDVTSLLGGGKYLWQMHSSNDDRVHSATVKDSNTYQDLGCLVYREDTRQHLFFAPRGDYDECQIDKSGRWLVIKENVDNAYNEDNRVIDIETGAEQVLWDQNGAAGHSDMGFGYIVGEDDKWAANPYGVRVWQFGANMTSAAGQICLCDALLERSRPRTHRSQQFPTRSAGQLADGVQQQCGRLQPRAHQRDRLLPSRRVDAGTGRRAEHDRPQRVRRRQRRATRSGRRAISTRRVSTSCGRRTWAATVRMYSSSAFRCRCSESPRERPRRQHPRPHPHPHRHQRPRQRQRQHRRRLHHRLRHRP